MHPDLVKALAGYGVSSLPSWIKLAVGRPAAKRLLGASRLKELAASTQYKGERAKPRSIWAPYVIGTADRYFVVTCPDPSDLPKQGWRSRPAIEAAAAHIAYLIKHKGSWQPPNAAYSLHECVQPQAGIVGIDIEGPCGSVDRIGIATKDQCISLQWTADVAAFAQEMFNNPALTFVAHNAPFDHYGLTQELGDGFCSRFGCTMVASRLINPWRPIGLGKCAPLYVPGLFPWKHLSATDPELYNLMDAAVLPPMWEKLSQMITSRHMDRAYRADLDFAYDHFAWELEHDTRITYSVNWVETAVTKAAGIIETARQGPGQEHQVDWWDAVCSAVGYELCYDEPPHSWHDGIIDRHILGYGPRQIRNGGQEFPNGVSGLPPGCKDKCIKEITDAFDKENPSFTKWRNRLRRQARKDGYVTAPDGRRGYGFTVGEVQRFVIFAEIGRRLKLAMKHNPLYINHAVVISNEAKPKILEALK